MEIGYGRESQVWENNFLLQNKKKINDDILLGSQLSRFFVA